MDNSRPKTLREAYELFESVGIIENDERRSRTERFLRLRWRGVPFGDSPIEFRNDDDTEVNYSKEMAEAISFAHLVVATNIDDAIANIENRTPPAPDLYVEMIDGSHIYAEVGQIVASDSARYFATIAKVNQHLMRRERDDSAYLDEIRERHVSVQLPMVPASSKTRATADAIVALFRSLDFNSVQRRTLIPADARTTPPLLASLNANYYVGDGTSTYVRANNSAHWFDPDESVRDFDRMLADKISKNYEADAPIWLALPLNDMMQVPMLSMGSIRSHIPANIGQFDRVFVGTLDDAVVVEPSEP